MEISKRKLISLLSESNYISDIDEMAKFWSKKKPGVRVVQSRLYDDNGKHIGYDMMVDPLSEDPDSERVQIVFTCDIDQFMEQHPEVVQRLKNDFGSFRWSDQFCTSGKVWKRENIARPLPGEEGDVIRTRKMTDQQLRDFNARQGKEFKPLEGSEKIKRTFLKIFREKVEKDDELKSLLNDRSIPMIELSGGLNKGQASYETNAFRKYFDTHGEVMGNEGIDFTVKSYNVYASTEEFNQIVADRIFGNDTPEMSTEYLARQFNKERPNWSPESKKGSKTDLGVTDVYGLRKYGYKEGQENEVLLEMTFEVKGEKIGETFVWIISLVNKFASRKPGKSFIDGARQPVKYKPDSIIDGDKISVVKNIQLNPNMEFSPDKTIMDYPLIVNGLLSAINDFKEEIRSINPETILSLTTPTRSDIEPRRQGAARRREMNEDKTINKLIKDVLTEMRSEYPVYHNSYTSAINAALKYVKSRGYEYDQEEVAGEIGLGPARPKDGQTNKFHIELTKDGKKQRKMLHIQVYGMGDKYELNLYIN